jgi:hypothetical protein
LCYVAGFATLLPYQTAHILSLNHSEVHMPATIVDVDEALTHLNLVPVAERGAAWRAYLDAVLDQRKESDVPNGN